MKQIKEFVKKNKSIFLAVFVASLMFSSVYGLINDYQPPSSSSNTGIHILPALNSQGETASTSTSIDYYTTQDVANSGTTTVNIPIEQNSSYSTGEFANSVYFSLNSAETVASYTQSLSGMPNYIYNTNSAVYTVMFDSLSFYLGIADNSGTFESEIGTVYVNLTIDGYTLDWSNAFNTIENTIGYFAIITPTYSLSGVPYYVMSDFSSATLSVVATSAFPLVYNEHAPADIATTTVDQGQNTLTTTSQSENLVPMVEGYHYGTATSTVPVPSTETSFEIPWSSPINSQVSYSATTTTQTGTSGTLAGDATHGSNQAISFTSNPNVADPSAGEDSAGYYVSASYYLSLQSQSTPATTTQTSAPTYTYSQVSGTTNEASSSFTFSASPPSGDIFTDYGGALTTTFTPTITIQNPYSTYTQNQLVASLTGSSTGSSTTSNTASPSFT